VAVHSDRGLEVAYACRAGLAEGPLWDGWTRTLWWVDIDGHRLWRKSPGRPASVHDFGQEVAAAIPRRDGGLALVVNRAIVLTDPLLTITGMIPVPLPASASMRLNDAACDAAGRLWFGSMATNGELGRASLYTLEVDHSVTCALAPVSISNGLGWSPDDRTMYYVDTPTGRIDSFRFDPETGRLGLRRTFATIPSAEGKPDGLTVDAAGAVWVALWGGAAVQRFSPSGRRAGRIELPVRNVSSCCFGGVELDELYITTARRGLSPEQVDIEPTAGSVFVCRPGSRGLPTYRFGG
jgi:sugar lactone lactonase YvrE